MKLWRISQTVNDDYDTYDSAVVAAETESDAKNIHPSGGNDNDEDRFSDDWASPENVQVEFIGEAKDGTMQGVICASFNAG